MGGKIFLEAVEPHDHSFLNYTLGQVAESFEAEQVRLRGLTTTSRHLLGVYRGEALFITFTKVDGDYAWAVSPPLGEDDADEEVISAALSTLASGVVATIDIHSVDRLIGPAHLVKTFVAHWTHEVEQRGVVVMLPTASSFESRISYATLATIPPPSPAFSAYRVELATQADTDELSQLFIVFIGRHRPSKAALDRARHDMDIWVQLGQIWVCRLDGGIAGYVATGRTTKRTVGIRNVFVSPNHRRKGVAEAMTRAVTRFMLGAKPLGFEGAPAGGPALGTKEQVCLNVVDEPVAQLYKRCGFLLGEDAEDPDTGRRGWMSSAVQTIEVLPRDVA